MAFGCRHHNIEAAPSGIIQLAFAQFDRQRIRIRNVDAMGGQRVQIDRCRRTDTGAARAQAFGRMDECGQRKSKRSNNDPRPPRPTASWRVRRHRTVDGANICLIAERNG